MYPFTEIQLKELELQTIMFNYFASGIPIPHHLISLFNRSFYVLIDPFALNPMNATKKVEEDPEPWRCKRTDGKKWRCSKEASKDSKYCERHMHRGRRSSRKLVEMHSPLSTTRPSFINQFPNPNIMLRLYEENKHGYVVDTELKLGNGDGRVEKEKEERKPSTLLRLFDECVDAEDSYSSSISFP